MVAQNEANNQAKDRHKVQAKWQVFFGGAVAGLVVDTSLYPIDTIKSRLQSKSGFLASGGYKNLYRGLPPVLAGSVPNAALFFLTYESVKNKLHEHKSLFDSVPGYQTLSHVIGASTGEIVSCTIRVPYEVVKMRSQTASSKHKTSNIKIIRNILAQEGTIGLYRGFYSTIMRDLPFSALQYPIWEKLKATHLSYKQKPVTAIESAIYGSLAGAIAAFLTTPLDVVKTRIMLAEKSDKIASGSVLDVLRSVMKEEGIRGCFAGVVPRVTWISVGAALFLGSYEQTTAFLAE